MDFGKTYLSPGGDFNRAGQRSRGELTTDSLRSLLEDDVNLAQRILASDSERTDDDITDEELAMIMDRQKVFSAEGIPTEGVNYDIVFGSTGGGGLLTGMQGA